MQGGRNRRENRKVTGLRQFGEELFFKDEENIDRKGSPALFFALVVGRKIFTTWQARKLVMVFFYFRMKFSRNFSFVNTQRCNRLQ